MRSRIRATADSPSDVPPIAQGTVKLSVNVNAAAGQRLRRVAFEERLSESSIVSIALDHLFSGKSDAALAQILRERGATLRRNSR
jgi:hypothetical protein